MKISEPLLSFLTKAKSDRSIKPSHVSMYLALYTRWLLNDNKNPFFITRETIMRSACIASIATYHKILRDLCKLIYVKYEPSYDPRIRTKVYIQEIK